MGVVGSVSVPQRGNRPGRAVSVAGGVVFIAIGTSGRRGNTTVENGSLVAFLRAGRVGAPVHRFGVVASAEWADHGVLAPGFDMAKLPAVAALDRGRRRVSSLN